MRRRCVRGAVCLRGAGGHCRKWPRRKVSGCTSGGALRGKWLRPKVSGTQLPLGGTLERQCGTAVRLHAGDASTEQATIRTCTCIMCMCMCMCMSRVNARGCKCRNHMGTTSAYHLRVLGTERKTRARAPRNTMAVELPSRLVKGRWAVGESLGGRASAAAARTGGVREQHR